MSAALLGLAALGVLSYELYFVASLVGLLVVVELTAPVAVAPRWRVRLRWLAVAGLVVFALVLVRRLVGLLPAGVVP